MSHSNINSRGFLDPSTQPEEEGEVPSSTHLIVEPCITDQEGDRELRASFAYVCRLLYLSHFLSTWNSRAFEFGAFLFLATIYSQTLLPASIYALSRAAAAAALSPWLGGYIDHADRLTVVRLSIVGQRISVATSCTVLFCLCQIQILLDSRLWSFTALALLSVLACIEKLSAVVNTISVERDWVVVIAQDNDDQLMSTYGNQQTATSIPVQIVTNVLSTAMNSQMRRIDLFCKLVAPLCVSLVDSISPQAAILATGGMTMLSVVFEYLAIARVHTAVPSLQAPKSVQTPRPTQPGISARLRTAGKASVASTITYMSHRAFLPSFALALLYLTVLSFNGQMITYLLVIGFNSTTIGILRGVSAVFELSATWIAPKVMHRIGPVRSGIWFINWEIICVSIACLVFWLPEFGIDGHFAAGATVAAVIASRIGLWGFDLSAQIIVQEEVEPELRGTFSSQEFAFQNVFEMLSFASTIVFSRPTQFKIPATISAGAVGVAGILYAAFVRSRRGHLVHLSRCMERTGKSRGSHYEGVWQPISQDEEAVADTQDDQISLT